MTQVCRWVMFCSIVVSGAAWSAQPLGCLIEPQQVAEIGSPVIGVIESIQVERGERVTKGQVIATLSGNVERAAIGVATSRAQAKADEQAASAALVFARQKLNRAKDLVERKFIAKQGLDQAQAEFEVAEQKLAQTIEQRRIAHREVGLASAQLDQRVIRSPFDGVVAERYLSVGERVEDKPLFRVAMIDPLKVLVVVPAAYYGKIQSGAQASVQPSLPDMPARSAKVTLVDRLIDAPSNTFRVQLELPNPDLALPAGMRCRVDFGPALPATAGAQPPAAAPVGVASQPVALTLDPTLSPREAPVASPPKRAN